jgi:signal transduction histidine kinase
LENQRIYPDVTRFDLGEQLSECLLQYEDTWERKHIELDVALEENIFVRADRELLALVWSNLFSNALKFTEEGGKVSLSLSATEHHATVTVKDTGCGISPEVGAHIFDKFYQGDTSHATEGNGLGLALVKRVVDITGGQILVQSTVGVGSTFTVTLRKNG